MGVPSVLLWTHYVPGLLGPGEVWELMPWPGCSVADDPGMMESLLHTDRVSVEEGVMFTFVLWSRHTPKSVFLSAPMCIIQIKTRFLSTHCQNYLCGWRCPPSPWRTWSGQCRAWSKAPDPRGQGSGLWSLPDTSLAFHGSAPGPPPSDLSAQSAHCCCWPWSRVSPQSAHSHRTAEGEKVITTGNKLSWQCSSNCRTCADTESFLVIMYIAYLVAVQCVLWSAGCQRDGVWLAAAFTLTVQVLSIPKRHTNV